MSINLNNKRARSATPGERTADEARTKKQRILDDETSASNFELPPVEELSDAKINILQLERDVQCAILDHTRIISSTDKALFGSDRRVLDGNSKAPRDGFLSTDAAADEEHEPIRDDIALAPSSNPTGASTPISNTPSNQPSTAPTTASKRSSTSEQKLNNAYNGLVEMYSGIAAQLENPVFGPADLSTIWLDMFDRTMLEYQVSRREGLQEIKARATKAANRSLAELATTELQKLDGTEETADLGSSSPKPTFDDELRHIVTLYTELLNAQKGPAFSDELLQRSKAAQHFSEVVAEYQMPRADATAALRRTAVEMGNQRLAGILDAQAKVAEQAARAPYMYNGASIFNAKLDALVTSWETTVLRTLDAAAPSGEVERSALEWRLQLVNFCLGEEMSQAEGLQWIVSHACRAGKHFMAAVLNIARVLNGGDAAATLVEDRHTNGGRTMDVGTETQALQQRQHSATADGAPGGNFSSQTTTPTIPTLGPKPLPITSSMHTDTTVTGTGESITWITGRRPLDQATTSFDRTARPPPPQVEAPPKQPVEIDTDAAQSPVPDQAAPSPAPPAAPQAHAVKQPAAPAQPAPRRSARLQGKRPAEDDLGLAEAAFKKAKSGQGNSARPRKAARRWPRDPLLEVPQFDKEGELLQRKANAELGYNIPVLGGASIKEEELVEQMLGNKETYQLQRLKDQVELHELRKRMRDGGGTSDGG